MAQPRSHAMACSAVSVSDRWVLAAHSANRGSTPAEVHMGPEFESRASL